MPNTTQDQAAVAYQAMYNAKRVLDELRDAAELSKRNAEQIQRNLADGPNKFGHFSVMGVYEVPNMRALLEELDRHMDMLKALGFTHEELLQVADGTTNSMTLIRHMFPDA